MNHKASQVGQAARDAVLLAGLASNRPAHPMVNSSVDRIGQDLERIDVDEITAQWLLANGIATAAPKPLKTEPDSKPFQPKEPKP